MIEVRDFAYTNKEFGVLVDKEVNVTAKEFNIIIPRLMPLIPLESQPKTKTENINCKIINSDFKYSKSITLSNSIVAKTATYFRTKLLGDVTKMEAVKEAETVEMLQAPLTHTSPITDPVSGALPPDPSTHNAKHKHEIKKPFKIDQMLYVDFDKEKVNNGKQVIVEFIGGDINNAYVTYIPDVLPKG